MNWNTWIKTLDINKIGLEIYMSELGYSKCDWENECDYCTTPNNGTYGKFDGDDGMTICGKCAECEIRAGNKILEEYKMKIKAHGNLPF